METVFVIITSISFIMYIAAMVTSQSDSQSLITRRDAPLTKVSTK
jgi:hypothetical protein